MLICRAYFSLEKIEDQMINTANFITLCSIHESLLFPANFLQTKLRDEFMSIDYWYESYERRFDVSKGKYMPMNSVMRRLHKQLRDRDGYYEMSRRHESNESPPDTVEDDSSVMTATTGKR
jgi:hypothetical protein